MVGDGIAAALDDATRRCHPAVRVGQGQADAPRPKIDPENPHRAAKIVMNLLAFARHSTLERSVEDLNDIVRSTLALRAVDLRAAKVKVTEEYASGLPLILANARHETSIGGTDWGMLQAGITVSIIPCILFYVFLQKYYVSGFTSGAVK